MFNSPHLPFRIPEGAGILYQTCLECTTHFTKEVDDRSWVSTQGISLC